MTKPLSMAAAERIWRAHREIDVGRKLLADINEALKSGSNPNPVDPFGRRRHFQLGVPMGDTGNRLLDVSAKLAACIIEAHIAEKQRELQEASIAAKVELGLTPAES